MPTTEKTRKIQELQLRLSFLKEQRQKLNSDASEWAKKRDRFNEQTKNLRIEIRELRDRRDELNSKVKELKQSREDTKKVIRQKVGEIRKLNQEIEVLAQQRPSENLQTLQRKLEQIEWKIQTTSLSLEEEKGLVGQVQKLGAKMNSHKKLGALRKKVYELQIELEAAKTRNKLQHSRLVEKAQRGQELHSKMLEKVDEAKELAAEADKMHKNYLNIRQMKDPIQDEIAEIHNRMKLMNEEIRKEEEEERKRAEKALKKKIKEKAKEKIKRGRRLTWEEFKILSEKEKATQD